MRRRQIIGFFVVTASFAWLAGTAFAQDFKPSINLNADSRPLTQEEKEKRKAVDEAYRSTIEKLPDKNKSTDPWGNLRSPTTTPSKQRQ
jgi:Na+/H+-dicarboxylate symporter